VAASRSASNGVSLVSRDDRRALAGHSFNSLCVGLK
jgi:hypothetical protein